MIDYVIYLGVSNGKYTCKWVKSVEVSKSKEVESCKSDFGDRYGDL